VSAVRGSDGKFRSRQSMDGIPNTGRMEKIIQTPEGPKTLYSFDGLKWSLSIEDAKKRASAAINLHGRPYAERMTAHVLAITNPGTDVPPAPVLLPVQEHGSAFLGRAKGKAQKYRRNLRRKKELLGVIPRPVHYHRCHNRSYVCSCDSPMPKRRPCGGDQCLKRMIETALAHIEHEQRQETLRTRRGK